MPTRKEVIAALKNVLDEGEPPNCCHDEFDLFLGRQIDDAYLESIRQRALAISKKDNGGDGRDLSPEGEKGIRALIKELEQRPAEAPDGPLYLFRNTNACTGAIYRHPDDKPLWLYAPPPSFWNFLNGPPRSPSFVLSDPTGKELLRIDRVSTFPTAKFVMTQEGNPLCSIRRTKWLMTEYTIEFPGGASWKMHLPMYSAYIGGESDRGSPIRVWLKGQLNWYVLFETGQDSMALVSAIAFIHSERIRCS